MLTIQHGIERVGDALYWRREDGEVVEDGEAFENGSCENGMISGGGRGEGAPPLYDNHQCG